ncbi:response regulator [Paenibacillus sp. TAB 01]|uniref:response regulator n=1 Tax=Paenibacillus sp. TAB 01 TaxID=3368988 RepID=UPI0037522735
MLLKVIAVDDELLVRNHLRSIIDWEQYGFTLCGEAGDGAEALQVIRELAPHLAIVDMNMPGMDGVELIQQLSQQYPGLRVLALSSYDSYEYVRGSLHFGAVDYLLKHRLSAETLVQVLNKIKEKLQDELKQQSDRQRERLKWEAAGPAVSQSYLKELFMGVGSTDEVKKYIDHFQEMSYGREGQQHVLLLMKLVNFEELHLRMNEQELTLFIRSVSDMALQILAEAGCAVYLERGSFGLLLSMELERSENGIQQWIEAKKARLQKSLELYFNCAVLFVQTGMFRTLASLPAQYAGLQHKLDELQGYVPKANQTEGAPVSYVTIHQEKELLAAAEACDAEQTLRMIREIARNCAADSERFLTRSCAYACGADSACGQNRAKGGAGVGVDFSRNESRTRDSEERGRARKQPAVAVRQAGGRARQASSVGPIFQVCGSGHSEDTATLQARGYTRGNGRTAEHYAIVPEQAV